LTSALKRTTSSLRSSVGELRVLHLGVLVAFLFQVADDGLERLVILAWEFLHAEHETRRTSGRNGGSSPCEAGVGGLFGECLDRLVVEP